MFCFYFILLFGRLLIILLKGKYLKLDCNDITFCILLSFVIIDLIPGLIKNYMRSLMRPNWSKLITCSLVQKI